MRREEYAGLVAQARQQSQRCAAWGRAKWAGSCGLAVLWADAWGIAALACRLPDSAALAPAPPCSLASLLERHDFVGGRAWLGSWEDAWRRNLRSCSRGGECHIQLT